MLWGYWSMYSNDLGTFDNEGAVYWEAFVDSNSTTTTEIFGNMFLPPYGGDFEVYPIFQNAYNPSTPALNLEIWHSGLAMEIDGSNTYTETQGFTTCNIPGKTSKQLYPVPEMMLTVPGLTTYQNVELVINIDYSPAFDHDAYMYGWIAIPN